MWLKKKNPSKETDAPEKLRHSRYYEHDGILRAYANRAMVLAFLCVPTTMLALAFAVYVRLQPPTVIRVDENGMATILGVNKPAVSVTQGTGSEPTEFEKRAFVHLFLERYLNFSPTNVSRNWADSLNMMTANLRRTAYTGMQKDDFIGKIEDDDLAPASNEMASEQVDRSQVESGVGVGGVQSANTLEARFGLVQLSQSEQNQAQLAERGYQRRVEFQRAPVSVRGGGESPFAVEDVTQAGIHLRGSRLKREPLLQNVRRVVIALQIGQREAKTVVDIPTIRVDGQRALVALDRRFGIARPVQVPGKRAEKLGGVGLQSDGAKVGGVGGV